jgi:hypothetical protein
MSSHHPPRHCFQRGYYYADTSTFVMVFTEGEMYSYPSFSPELWALIKLASQRGVLFNASDRRPSRVSAIYDRIWALPPGYIDSFTQA